VKTDIFLTKMIQYREIDNVLPSFAANIKIDQPLTRRQKAESPTFFSVNGYIIRRHVAAQSCSIDRRKCCLPRHFSRWCEWTFFVDLNVE
jgi:hypothetical protein